MDRLGLVINMLWEFVQSSSGQVVPVRALGTGWVAAACAGLAAVLSSVSPAAAGGCGWGGTATGDTCVYGRPGEDAWCASNVCQPGGLQYGCCQSWAEAGRCYCWC